MASQTTLLDLPVDLLLLIIPHLPVVDYLNFTSSCRYLHDAFIDEHTYWAQAIRKTFRIANQPVVERDGARWHKLYKKLKTQTRVYGWGDNNHNCLDLTFWDDVSEHSARQVMRRRRQLVVSWPEEIQTARELGVISDMQCGGWSTSVLTSAGTLHVCGVLDGGILGQTGQSMSSPLTFPPGYLAARTQDPYTSIRQYSHGRSHVLGLSDSGAIWSWKDAATYGMKIKFIHHDAFENRSGRGTVSKVVAGWGKSAAIINSKGIVLWDPIGRARGRTDTADITMVVETASIVENKQSGRILNVVVLENVIVYCTDLGLAFVSQIRDTGHLELTEPVELPNAQDSITDVQGSFRSLAVFTKSGAVLIAHQDRLFDLMRSGGSQSPLFERIPALQNNQVISIAFGDYHYHALHATGHITSYGKEPQSCGAFGLGGYAWPEGRLRGIRSTAVGNPGGALRQFGARTDGSLVPHAYQHGRRIWFDTDKREWVKFLTSGGADPQEAAARMRLAMGVAESQAQGEVSEWIEQEGKDWKDKYDVRQPRDDGLPAYFALTVCAGGWHSGALVLVNEDLAGRITKAVEVPVEAEPVVEQTTSLYGRIVNSIQDTGMWFLGMGPYSATSPQTQAVRQEEERLAWGASPRAGFKYRWADDHFPRLRLSDGTEMPGEVPFDAWRYGEPLWDLP